jgi:hypothetical protein
MEAFVAQPFDATDGERYTEPLFGPGWTQVRAPNPENRGGFLTVLAGGHIQVSIQDPTLVKWTAPRQMSSQAPLRGLTT